MHLELTPRTRRFAPSQAGDTIVEVLVVLAILGLTLGVSYATANHSLLATRSAEENSQATTLLQGQIEDLRFLANPTTPSTIFNQGHAFCIDSSNNIFAATNAHCKNLDSLYNVTITYQNTPTQPDTFTLVAYWQDLQAPGNGTLGAPGTDTVTLVCRVHKGT